MTRFKARGKYMVQVVYPDGARWKRESIPEKSFTPLELAEALEETARMIRDGEKRRADAGDR